VEPIDLHIAAAQIAVQKRTVPQHQFAAQELKIPVPRLAASILIIMFALRDSQTKNSSIR
jgi:hypothetical protein